MNNDLMTKIVSLAKRRGFIYPGSEIYGGLKGTWDYGPLGSELKFNIKQEWWKTMVKNRDDVVGMSTSILMNPRVWEASGHMTGFNDPLIECKTCHQRFKADQEDVIAEHENWHKEKKEKVDWTKVKKFNLLVETKIGVVEGEKNTVYLRGEITQGVHVNFKNVLSSSRLKIPFGIAQIGKAFRNEITPGNFTYRSIEFEQMELQYYVKPDKKESMKQYEFWKNLRMDWYKSLGINSDNLRFREHEKSELAHYAKEAWDIEYKAPFGWKECEGIHHRGDWDLARHQEFSGQDMSYFDEETGKKYIPWVIETSGGVDRAALFFLIDAYSEEDDRIILKLNPKLAPYKVAVFPLLANKPQLVKKAREIYEMLKSPIPQFPNYPITVAWDDRGNIGKRYYSQDEIGTPFCITVDFESLEKDDVTVRDRDTMKQVRIRVEKLINYIKEKIC
ncbi:glycine--tRNA ligase [Candidatus Wolfebacteria bacterium CG1_02_39_135]|uniref:Glycine--tRNA ligase n=5 Tax=Candidatus Wolfeibacteriota TaxID=1752735 RepID=A0A2M7Q7Z8_9BACT|nr:glycine--tRNA ligase [Parcubacteria group bacterium]NCO89523.1 glycine--tRNA ligase [Candidatus Wolfebacteria bacterium]OIO65361.1 MAG: glycine--tRNA ligase [Candidatus Wolfebacteria bacterium CG1_02_39_135]PIU98831.1 MAG: glycine--tRNA ligase [Candidatus Wolfebacteria bacterium CG03_land_8_20_14_0_80_39_317]PIY59094.1 MAG: glycine--tRNA ligase [Candidatus Wolfebacteria bacterium CG_4_10_14_0_8_um_filter_39_64]PJB83441.1 MAG: glycine--tRNA ligase [Candidatus Wolfebacteria bacterium CG_4_9_1